MNSKMQIANMLADNIHRFIQFVHKNYHDQNKTYIENPDKFYQVKLLVEEYKFQVIADELKRINEFSWNEKYTLVLVERFLRGISVIDEYIKNHYHDLFILSARIYTLKDICSVLTSETIS